MTEHCPVWRVFALCVGLAATQAAAQAVPQVEALELALPATATLTAERTSPLDSFDAPVAGFDGTGVGGVTVEGQITRRAWRISLPGLTPLQVMQPLRQQIEDQGYVLVFECEAVDCGGFDFRFNIEVLPGPNMYVNISRYRYLTALRGDPDAPDQTVGILVSTTAEAAYVQVITALRLDDQALPLSPSPSLALSETTADIETVPEAVEAPANSVDLLLAKGRIVLGDLDFALGTSDLGPGPFASLTALAQFLKEESDVRVALVGHTDTTGPLEPNIIISRARARSVRTRLVEEYGIEAARLDAEGMGYLAPIASNSTEEGRGENRRVEVILLSDN